MSLSRAGCKYLMDCSFLYQDGLILLVILEKCVKRGSITRPYNIVNWENLALSYNEKGQ